MVVEAIGLPVVPTDSVEMVLDRKGEGGVEVLEHLFITPTTLFPSTTTTLSLHTLATLPLLALIRLLYEGSLRIRRREGFLLRW